MSKLLCHRGPDDAGVCTLGPVAFGFRRLSIIDIEGGHQPMRNEDESVWVVFNGEIYNFRELRESLQATGRHSFKTKSDTEVLLHLYEEYGDHCVDHLRGMFAFAIWDKKRQRLFAARDRFGEKPFFYFVAPNGTLVFASELNSLRKHPNCPTQVDPHALNLYLSLQYVPAPKTIFAKVNKLPASHALSWTASGGLRTWRYWDLHFEPKGSLSYGEAKQRLRVGLTEAVKLRMTADVPLGAFLSGGIDSSIVVALMAQNSSLPIKTFSIGFDEERFSELPYARAVSERYKTDHQEFVVRPELIDVLPKLAWHYSEPFADASALPSYYLAKETRRHVTVALTGDGGDEMFGGYFRYRALWVMEYWNRLPAAMRRWIAKAADDYLPVTEASVGWSWRLQRLLGVGARPVEEQFGRTLEYFHADELAELWRPEFKVILSQPAGLSNAMFADSLKSFDARENLDRWMSLDLRHYLPDGLMTKVDIAAMAHSLEARAPFLDHILMQEVAQWPSKWKYRPPNFSKRILKETFAQDLPGGIVRRGKQGFGVPLSRWFRGPLRKFVEETLLSSNPMVSEYLRVEVIRRYVEEQREGTRDRSFGIWALLILELWLRRNKGNVE
jgi:asparagine synthase (glutamine-hydrolysing)